MERKKKLERKNLKEQWWRGKSDGTRKEREP
jgi:hypothetical protein